MPNFKLFTFQVFINIKNRKTKTLDFYLVKQKLEAIINERKKSYERKESISNSKKSTRRSLKQEYLSLIKYINPTYINYTDTKRHNGNNKISSTFYTLKPLKETNHKQEHAYLINNYSVSIEIIKPKPKNSFSKQRQNISVYCICQSVKVVTSHYAYCFDVHNTVEKGYRAD